MLLQGMCVVIEQQINFYCKWKIVIFYSEILTRKIFHEQNKWKIHNSIFNWVKISVHTVIPRLARFWWQEKNRVRWNSCYASQNGTFFYCQMPGQMTLLYTSVVSYKTLLLTITCVLYHFCKVENIFGKKFQKNLHSTIYFIVYDKYK